MSSGRKYLCKALVKLDTEASNTGPCSKVLKTKEAPLSIPAFPPEESQKRKKIDYAKSQNTDMSVTSRGSNSRLADLWTAIGHGSIWLATADVDKVGSVDVLVTQVSMKVFSSLSIARPFALAVGRTVQDITSAYNETKEASLHLKLISRPVGTLGVAYEAE
ncbi:uncharacterized protein EV420DRAFT_1483849 [Desarmillaria tabescens]|uniref:Uncharacterized protein n=1 Tax=Armillaria tabescens TaxID=1929756 RepID=A0AA39MUR0_ARMTA|nr:uncharacterized protein EV420DRAFT_1483849 [Desarmillaria tabescens]KAK0446943.1 hypothetical protein EV420DRAFT_1483849 [Desarmillaria tabescens]